MLMNTLFFCGADKFAETLIYFAFYSIWTLKKKKFGDVAFYINTEMNLKKPVNVSIVTEQNDDVYKNSEHIAGTSKNPHADE